MDLDRADALRSSGLVDGGVEPVFTRLARLLVNATRTHMCVLAFGDDPAKLVKACAGPPEVSPTDILSLDLYRDLLRGEHAALAKGDVAGSVVYSPSGLPVGAWCTRTEKPRTWTEGTLETLADIARLTQVELSLREKRRPDDRAFEILEGMSDACVYLDKDFRYAFVNKKAGEIFGREPQSLIGKHIWTEFPDGVAQRFDHAYREAARTQRPMKLEEYYAPWKRWFENRIYPGPDGLAIFFTDVTERREAEDEARNDALVRTQAEQMAHLGFWSWDIPKNQVRWSDELYRIYGIDKTKFEASFDAYLARVHPQDVARVRDLVERAVRERVQVTFDERIVRPNGEIRHLHSWGNIMLDEAGQPAEMRGACLDMTELIVTTEGLRRTEEWLTVALESAGVAVFEWNVHSHVVRWADGSARAFGLTDDELRRSFDGYLEHVHRDDLEAFSEAIRVSVDKGTPLDHEHRVMIPKDGERWVWTHATPFKDASGKVERLVGTVMDVSERHRTAEERRKLEEELRHAQKMDAIGRLASSVAHDFNNLLTVIRNSTALLTATADLGQSDRETVDGIEEAARRATVLIKQILAFSKNQNVVRAPLDLDDVIRDASATLRRLLPEPIKLVVSLSPGMPPVLANRSQIEQVLLNLVVNARDAMPEGGTVSITTRLDGNFAELEVKDTGVGMSAELRSQVFEPFFTTKDAGTGIGLSTVYGIVVGNGGTIDVQTEPGAGAAFSIRLPLASKP